MSQDEQHLKLLSIFHYIMGGLTALFSCMFLIHIVMGVAMLSGEFDGENAPPEVFAWFFIVFPAAFMLFGWAMAVLIIMAGRRLKRRVSHTFCLVVAGLECIIIPFGTVLGVFTIIVLMKDSVKELFAVQDRISS